MLMILDVVDYDGGYDGSDDAPVGHDTIGAADAIDAADESVVDDDDDDDDDGVRCYAVNDDNDVDDHAADGDTIDHYVVANNV